MILALPSPLSLCYWARIGMAQGQMAGLGLSCTSSRAAGPARARARGLGPGRPSGSLEDVPDYGSTVTRTRLTCSCIACATARPAFQTPCRVPGTTKRQSCGCPRCADVAVHLHSPRTVGSGSGCRFRDETSVGGRHSLWSWERLL